MLEKIESQNIVLQRYSMEDSAAVFHAIKHSYAEISPWLDWLTPHYSLKDAEKFIKRQIQNWHDGLEYTFAIKNHSGDFLGTIALHIYDRQNDVASVGYWIDSRYSGQGNCSQALRLLVNNTLRLLHLIRIEIIVATTNYASQKVALNAGAVFEAVLKHRIRINGKATDANIYAFTQSP